MEPEPVIMEPEPEPVVVMEPGPVVIEPGPEPVVAIEPEPIVESEPEPPFRRLTRISGTGTVSGNAPADTFVFATGLLEPAPSMRFVWDGEASEYRFALYRTNGEEIVPPVEVIGSSYTLMNPGAVLTEGDYMWQLFEKDSEGNWILSRENYFTVNKGEAELKTIPVQKPEALYGN
jgi:hypothetical protein